MRIGSSGEVPGASRRCPTHASRRCASQFRTLLEQVRELHKLADGLTRSKCERIQADVRARLNWNPQPPSLPPEQLQVADVIVDLLEALALVLASPPAPTSILRLVAVGIDDDLYREGRERFAEVGPCLSEHGACARARLVATRAVGSRPRAHRHHRPDRLDRYLGARGCSCSSAARSRPWRLGSVDHRDPCPPAARPFHLLPVGCGPAQDVAQSLWRHRRASSQHLRIEERELEATRPPGGERRLHAECMTASQ